MMYVLTVLIFCECQCISLVTITTRQHNRVSVIFSIGSSTTSSFFQESITHIVLNIVLLSVTFDIFSRNVVVLEITYNITKGYEHCLTLISTMFSPLWKVDLADFPLILHVYYYWDSQTKSKKICRCMLVDLRWREGGIISVEL